MNQVARSQLLGTASLFVEYGLHEELCPQPYLGILYYLKLGVLNVERDTTIVFLSSSIRNVYLAVNIE